MRRRLPGAFNRALVLVVLLVLALAVAAPGCGAGARSGDSGLSFKEFDVGQLLRFQLEIDTATSGRPLDSPKLTLIEERTSELRGLPLKNKVPFVEAGETVVRYQMMEDFSEESSADELEADEVLLVELGLFPRGRSLEQLLTDVYTEQIAGSYDTEAKVITIVSGKSSSGAMDELTISHETVHALQDQNYGLDKAPLDSDEYNGDEDLAITSLIEGDATLHMVEYGREHMSVSQLQELGSEEVSSEQLDNAPAYVRKSILFPYEDGFTFVQRLSIGGRQAIDAALADPPMSSEQILHPEKYIDARDDPREVPVPDLSGALGEGWRKTNEDCMGEFDVNAWFEEYVEPAGRREVGAGWGGNTIQLYEGPGDRTAIVNSFVWDSESDASEFYYGYRDLLEGRFGDELTEVASKADAFLMKAEGRLFYCGLAGDGTLALQAHDDADMGALLESFPEFPAVP